MILASLKRSLPRSLYGRALLILVLPIIALQVVVTAVFIQRHYAGVTSQMAASVALELAYAVESAEAAGNPAEAQARLDAIAMPLGLFLSLEPGQTVAGSDRRRFFDVSGRAMSETFRERLARPVVVDLLSDDEVIFVRLGTALGVVAAEVPRRRMVASNPHLLLVWMLVTSGVLTFIAVLFLRNQVRPIRELAQAAEAFGKGHSLRFRPAGAEEVRRAGGAFLAMRARIERQIEQRTRMLTGVSHDLRTPLTRMKLALTLLEPGEETEGLARDVEEMERMVEGFLAFARGEGGEDPVATDPGGLVAEIADGVRRAGGRIEVSLAPEAAAEPLIVRRLALKRAVQNLVDNALSHGSHVALRVAAGPDWVAFIVEDDGPGIPEDARADALRPFVRLDPARNQNAHSGLGLGLAIALDIARTHGGTLDLAESPGLGGLRATLRLPR